MSDKYYDWVPDEIWYNPMENDKEISRRITLIHGDKKPTDLVRKYGVKYVRANDSSKEENNE
jgi:hypothetical protein